MDNLSQLAARAAAKSLTRAELIAHSAALGLAEEDVVDSLAVSLAHGYLSGQLSFEVSDEAIVHLIGIYNYGQTFPELAWEIWSSFDDGESTYPGDRPDSCPQEQHTRPGLLEVLQRHGQMP